MPLVLFNTGWMKHYRGLTPSDQVFNGGSYVEENETGSEIRNFEPLQGRCYGYASPRGTEVNISNSRYLEDSRGIRGLGG